MEAVDVRGRFVWHELITRDVSAAKKFYSKLVGWKPQAWPLDPSYTVCNAEVGPVAGITSVPANYPPEAPSHWLGYIGTSDVDATVEAAIRAGGSVVAAANNMQGAGRYAVLKDPQGAIFAVITPEKARPESSDVPPAGDFSWHELATTDCEAAFAFYSGLFGWEAITRMNMGPVGTYLIFGSGGKQRGGIYNKPPEMPAPPSWLPYAHVANADAAADIANGTGGKVCMGPQDVPGGGRIAAVTDPSGAAFAIHSLPAAVAAVAPKRKAKASTKPAKKLPKKARPKVKVKAKAKAKAKTKTKLRVTTKAKAKAKPKKAAPKKKAKSPARRKK